MSKDTSTHSFPVSHVVGFLMSLVLTFSAAFLALKTELPVKTIVWIIGSFAILQAVLQLYMFMHMNEGEDRKTNAVNIIYAFLLAVIIVAGSIWVMAFAI